MYVVCVCVCACVSTWTHVHTRSHRYRLNSLYRTWESLLWVFFCLTGECFHSNVNNVNLSFWEAIRWGSGKPWKITNCKHVWLLQHPPGGAHRRLGSRLCPACNWRRVLPPSVSEAQPLVSLLPLPASELLGSEQKDWLLLSKIW